MYEINETNKQLILEMCFEHEIINYKSDEAAGFAMLEF